MTEDATESVNIIDDSATSQELVRRDFGSPRILRVFPIRERPFFPGQFMPLVFPEDPWLRTIEDIEGSPEPMAGVLLMREETPKIPRPEDLHAVGTVVRVHEPKRGPGMVQFVAEGLARFKVADWLSEEPPLVAHVDYPRSPTEDTDRIKAYGLAILNTVKELLPLNPLYGEQLRMFLNRFDPNDPSPFADFAANLTSADRKELQEILETIPLLARMERVLLLIKKELDVAKLQAQIRAGVEQRMTEQQRTFFLRQQLEEIQRELGISKDDRTAELDRFRERLETLEPSEKAAKRIADELDKMSVLEVGSPEYAVTRNYLDWITSLPWGRYSEDKLDIVQARRVLDRDHEGLDDVKERIVEFLAVGAYKGAVGGSIILFVGPPGVGKTSIGRSIAEALGREFFRFSLGGMRDEAEIKGHRRTYIGALPGKFIQAIKETGVSNPVIMIDEIDKVGTSFQGDPASALLEVLDPEQNVDFLDHYLDIPFDLSKVLFICTANQLDTIPRPLLDRMEMIHLAGYIAREKIAIAKRHLWPKLLDKTGIKRSKIRLSDAALKRLVEGYAREAGVRALEKQLGRIVRKAVVKLLEDPGARLSVTVDNLEDYLGKPLFRRKKPFTGVGVVTGLAWTALGGTTMDIEASRVHVKGRSFLLTGQLGNVMKESAKIAYSYVVSHQQELVGKRGFFDKASIHLHVPEGATPKDGPSAGISMATALVSLARGRRLPRPLAMTGELTLTGRVLAIGGLREKVIAARRVGVMEILFPDDNRRDFEELPEHLGEGFTVHFVKDYDEVAEIVFGSRK